MDDKEKELAVLDKILRFVRTAYTVFMGVIEASLIYLMIRTVKLSDVPSPVKYAACIFFILAIIFVTGMSMMLFHHQKVMDNLADDFFNDLEEEQEK